MDNHGPFESVATSVERAPIQEPSVTDLDMLYRETDGLYDRLARGCGLSEAAYWILYAIQVAGGEGVTQRDIADRLSSPKQTINSAVRTLETRGLVALDYAPGSRRSKVISLTRQGRAFAAERIVPAMKVERRAFARLEPAERIEFVRLATKYARAVDEEMAGMGRAMPADEATTTGEAEHE